MYMWKRPDRRGYFCFSFDKVVEDGTWSVVDECSEETQPGRAPLSFQNGVPNLTDTAAAVQYIRPLEAAKKPKTKKKAKKKAKKKR